MTDATERVGLGKVIYSVDDKPVDEPTQRRRSGRATRKLGGRSRNHFPQAILRGSPAELAQSLEKNALTVPASGF